MGCVIEKSKSSRSGRRGPSRSRGTTGRRIRYRWSMVETATSFVSSLSSNLSSSPPPSPSSPRQLQYVPIAFSQQSSCHYEAVLHASGSFLLSRFFRPSFLFTCCQFPISPVSLPPQELVFFLLTNLRHLQYTLFFLP